MSKETLPKPTDRELDILRVLWKEGACTIRRVCDVLNQESATGYTTVLKLMQIMADKGLVSRDESAKAHVYRARYAEEQTQRQLVGNLLRQAFGGSAPRLVMQALEGRQVSKDELAEIRAILDAHDRGE